MSLATATTSVFVSADCFAVVALPAPPPNVAIETAVAILEGRLNIYAPCLSQVARMLNVSVTKVRAALPQHSKQKRHAIRFRKQH